MAREYVLPDETMGGVPESIAEGPAGVPDLEARAGLDFSQIKEKDTVYRNYDAHVPPQKGKVQAISTDDHGTGFITVAWEDDSESVELASWLRLDKDHPVGHIEPDLFQTQAGLSSVFDSKKAVIDGEHIKVVRSSMNNSYEIYVDGVLKHTALSMEEVKNRLDDVDVYTMTTEEEDSLGGEPTEPLLYGDSVEHEAAKMVARGMLYDGLPFDTAFEIVAKEYPQCHYNVVRFLADVACRSAGLKKAEVVPDEEELEEGTFEETKQASIDKTGLRINDEVIATLDDGTESYGLVEKLGVGGVQVYLEDGTSAVIDRTKVRPK